MSDVRSLNRATPRRQRERIHGQDVCGFTAATPKARRKFNPCFLLNAEHNSEMGIFTRLISRSGLGDLLIIVASALCADFEMESRPYIHAEISGTAAKSGARYEISTEGTLEIYHSFFNFATLYEVVRHAHE